MGAPLAIEKKTSTGTGLWIAIHHQNFPAKKREGNRQIYCCRGFSDAAFEADDTNTVAHNCKPAIPKFPQQKFRSNLARIFTCVAGRSRG
jgi:hypothetical protein